MSHFELRDEKGRFVGRPRSLASAHRWSRRANMAGGSVSEHRAGEVDLSKIRVLYRDVNMQLWGIPYDMREGQSPRDLQRAYEQYVPPRPGHYGSKRIELGWTWLGSPGWWGSMSKARRAEVEDFLAWFKDAVPSGFYEFSVLPDEDNWPYKSGSANRAGADMTVANIILAQLGGGGRLRAMIGAKDFSGGDNVLTFRFAARAKNGANTIRITLEPSDTYKVEFHSVRGRTVKLKGSFDDIYAEDLIPLFERETGLYLRM